MPFCEAEIALMTSPTAEGIARVVGLIDPAVDFMDGDDSDARRQEVFSRQLGVLQQGSPQKQKVVHHETAAKYLPGLVTKFRQSDDNILDSVALVLNSIAYTPYFVRFQCLAQEGNGLAVLYANRCVKYSSDMERFESSTVGEISQFLSTLLVLQGIADIDATAKKIIITVFKKLERKHRTSFTAETLRRCIDILEDDRDIRPMFQMAKEMIEAPYKECGAKSCKARDGEGQSLMQCARCKAALYCSAEHQRSAWSAHKAICFPSSF